MIISFSKSNHNFGAYLINSFKNKVASLFWPTLYTFVFL